MREATCERLRMLWKRVHSYAMGSGSIAITPSASEACCATASACACRANANSVCRSSTLASECFFILQKRAGKGAAIPGWGAISSPAEKGGKRRCNPRVRSVFVTAPPPPTAARPLPREHAVQPPAPPAAAAAARPQTFASAPPHPVPISLNLQEIEKWDGLCLIWEGSLSYL